MEVYCWRFSTSPIIQFSTMLWMVYV